MKDKEIQFDWNICGHEKNIEFLQLSIKNKNISNAYLFAGSSNLGKNTVAQKFITSIFCQNKIGTVPCGECTHCKQLESNVHPDVYRVSREVDQKTGNTKKNISVDQIRNLKNRLQQGTLLNSYKVAIIPQAEYINISGANALLKILEEPTSNTVIILITSDINKVPKTIFSRCQVIRFLPVSQQKIESYIEKLDPQKDSKNISCLSYGRPGVALDFLRYPDRLDHYNNNINKFFEIIPLDISKRLMMIDGLIDWKKDEALNINLVNELLSNWQMILRDIMLVGSDNEPLVSNFEFLSGIKQGELIFSGKKIRKTMHLINQARYYFSSNVNSRLVLENLIINI